MEWLLIINMSREDNHLVVRVANHALFLPPAEVYLMLQQSLV